jgi:hypothetical protein
VENRQAVEDLLSVIQVRAAHGQEDFVQVPPELAAVPYALDMTSLECIARFLIIRRYVLAGGLPDDPSAGKADSAGAYGELIG